MWTRTLTRPLPVDHINQHDRIGPWSITSTQPIDWELHPMDAYPTNLPVYRHLRSWQNAGAVPHHISCRTCKCISKQANEDRTAASSAPLTTTWSEISNAKILKHGRIGGTGCTEEDGESHREEFDSSHRYSLLVPFRIQLIRRRGKMIKKWRGRGWWQRENQM